MKKMFILFSVFVLGVLFYTPATVAAASETTQKTNNESVEFVSLNPTNGLKKKAPPSSDEPIRFSKFKKNILQNDTELLEVQNVAPDSKISFSSSDTSVLSVAQTSDTTCNYTGVGYGSAKIIVKISKPGFLFFDSKQEMEVKINVTPHAVSVVFRKSTRNILVGQSIKLPYTLRPSISKEKPIFSSLRKKIATVNHKGNVKGRKAGITFIYATLSNGKSAKCKIIVKKNKDI